MRARALLLCLWMIPAAAWCAENPDPSTLFDALLGHWLIEDETLGAEGNWQAGAGAAWQFYRILNGQAIQDDWSSPHPARRVNGTATGFGTNIRVYNPAKSQWEMAWISSTGRQVDTFTATGGNSEIHMQGDFNGRPVRIVFRDIQDDSFAWALSQQVAGAEGTPAKWTEVYRIHATRDPDAP